MFGLSLHHNIDTRKNSLVNENIFIRFLFAGQNDYRFFEIIIGDIWIFVVILGWYRKDRKRTGIAFVSYHCRRTKKKTGNKTISQIASISWMSPDVNFRRFHSHYTTVWPVRN